MESGDTAMSIALSNGIFGSGKASRKPYFVQAPAFPLLFLQFNKRKELKN